MPMAVDRADSLVELLATGVAVMVGTADDDGHPSITRAWGPSFDRESSMLEVAVTAPVGSATLANLEANGRLSVTLSQPTTYRTLQTSGVVDHLGVPSGDDRRRVQDHLARFIAEVAAIGVTSGAEGFFLDDLVMVTFVVDIVYEQTPGDRAGTRL